MNDTSLKTIQALEESEVTGRVVPQALDLEESLLGALLLEKDALTATIDILKPTTFYKEAHQEIYKAILELSNKSESVDLFTVTNQLKKNGTITSVGGPAYIAQLTDKVISAANVETHAHLIVEHSMRRELISVATSMQKNAYKDTQDVFDLLDRSEQALFEITKDHIRKNYTDIRTLIKSAYKEIEIRKNKKQHLSGIPSGFITLDRLTMGWQKSDLIIVAARPGMGKTAFMLSAMRNAAVSHSHPVAIFSLEMSAIQLVNRLISAESGLEHEKIRRGKLANHEWEQLIHKTNALYDAPIYIDDTPALSIFELRAKCRRLKIKHNIQVAAIDYLQLMTNELHRKGYSNREQEVAMISRSLKSIAKELEIPIIAISQLSRAVETRGGNKRPQLSDMRDSGSLEQDADMVLFLYRPDYYGFTESEVGYNTKEAAELIVAKHRNGALDNVLLKYKAAFTQFADFELSEQPQSNYDDLPFGTLKQPSKANTLYDAKPTENNT